MTTTEYALTPTRLAIAVEALCSPGTVARRRDWSDGSAELRLRGGKHTIVITSGDGLNWLVSGLSREHAVPTGPDTGGALSLVSYSAAAELVDACEKWADR